jgi:hypothetical protein
MHKPAKSNPQRPVQLSRLIVLLALTGVIAACDRPASQAQRSPDANTTAAAPVAPLPSFPSAAESVKREDTANANDQPMKPMTKAEESTSMPQPAQANDHSTVAGDDKK